MKPHGLLPVHITYEGEEFIVPMAVPSPMLRIDMDSEDFRKEIEALSKPNLWDDVEMKVGM